MTERVDSYAGFARHYDLHGWDWYASTYGKRLFQLLEERGMKGSSLLDAGCGTGTLALELARHGYRVTGIDLSQAMLEVARGKDAEGRVEWRRADVTALDLGATFDVVTCVADILNHLEDLAAWSSALRGFARHLRPGGLLFVDVMTRLGLERLEGFTVRETAHSALIVGSIWEPASRRSTLKITSFLRDPATGRYDRASDAITEWGQPVEDVLRSLAAAGFDAVERPFGVAADPEAEERLAVLARRS